MRKLYKKLTYEDYTYLQLQVKFDLRLVSELQLGTEGWNFSVYENDVMIIKVCAFSFIKMGDFTMIVLI